MDKKDKTRCGSCKAERRQCQYELLYDEAQLQIDSLQRQVRHLRVEAQRRSEEHDALGDQFREYQRSRPEQATTASASGENPSCVTNQNATAEMKERHSREMQKAQNDFAKERQWWKREVQKRDSRILEVEGMLKTVSRASNSSTFQHNTNEPPSRHLVSNRAAVVQDKPAAHPKSETPQRTSPAQNEPEPHRSCETSQKADSMHNTLEPCVKLTKDTQGGEKLPISSQVKHIMDSLFGEDSDSGTYRRDKLCKQSTSGQIDKPKDLVVSRIQEPDTSKGNSVEKPKSSVTKKTSVKQNKTSVPPNVSSEQDKDDPSRSCHVDNRDTCDKKYGKSCEVKSLSSKIHSMSSSQEHDKSASHKKKYSEKDKGRSSGHNKVEDKNLARPPSGEQDRSKSHSDQKHSRVHRDEMCKTPEQSAVMLKVSSYGQEKPNLVDAKQGHSKEDKILEPNKSIAAEAHREKSSKTKDKDSNSSKNAAVSQTVKQSAKLDQKPSHAPNNEPQSKTEGQKTNFLLFSTETRKRKMSDNSEYATVEQGRSVKRTKSCSESSVLTSPDGIPHGGSCSIKLEITKGPDIQKSNKEKSSKSVLPSTTGKPDNVSTKETRICRDGMPLKQSKTSTSNNANIPDKTSGSIKVKAQSFTPTCTKDKPPSLLKASSESKLKPSHNSQQKSSSNSQKSRGTCQSKNANLSDKDRLEAYLTMAEKQAIERNKSHGYPKTNPRSCVDLSDLKYPAGTSKLEESGVIGAYPEGASRNSATGIAGDLGWLKLCKPSTSANSSPCKQEKQEKPVEPDCEPQTMEYRPTVIGHSIPAAPTGPTGYVKPKFKYHGRAPPKKANGPSKLKADRKTPWPTNTHEEYDPLNPEITTQLNVPEQLPKIESYSTKTLKPVHVANALLHQKAKVPYQQPPGGLYCREVQDNPQTYQTSSNKYPLPPKALEPSCFNMKIPKLDVGNLPSQVDFSSIGSNLLNDVKKALDTVRSVSPVNVIENLTDHSKRPAPLNTVSELTKTTRVPLPSPNGLEKTGDPSAEITVTGDTNPPNKAPVDVPMPSPLKGPPKTTVKTLPSALLFPPPSECDKTTIASSSKESSETRFADVAVKSGLVRRKRKDASQTKSILKKSKCTGSSDDLKSDQNVTVPVAMPPLGELGVPVEEAKVESRAKSSTEMEINIQSDGPGDVKEKSDESETFSNEVGKELADLLFLSEKSIPDKPETVEESMPTEFDELNNLGGKPDCIESSVEKDNRNDSAVESKVDIHGETDHLNTDITDQVINTVPCNEGIDAAQHGDHADEHPDAEKLDASPESGQLIMVTGDQTEVGDDVSLGYPLSEDQTAAAMLEDYNNSSPNAADTKPECENISEYSLFDAALNVGVRGQDVSMDADDASTTEVEPSSPDGEVDMPCDVLTTESVPTATDTDPITTDVQETPIPDPITTDVQETPIPDPITTDVQATPIPDPITTDVQQTPIPEECITEETNQVTDRPPNDDVVHPETTTTEPSPTNSVQAEQNSGTADRETEKSPTTSICVIKEEPIESKMHWETDNSMNKDNHTNSTDTHSSEKRPGMRSPDTGKKDSSSTVQAVGDDGCMIVISDSDSCGSSRSSESAYSGSSSDSDQSGDESSDGSDDQSGSDNEEQTVYSSDDEDEEDTNSENEDNAAETDSDSDTDTEESHEPNDPGADQDSENSDVSGNEGESSDSDSEDQSDAKECDAAMDVSSPVEHAVNQAGDISTVEKNKEVVSSDEADDSNTEDISGVEENKVVSSDEADEMDTKDITRVDENKDVVSSDEADDSDTKDSSGVDENEAVVSFKEADDIDTNDITTVDKKKDVVSSDEADDIDTKNISGVDDNKEVVSSDEADDTDKDQEPAEHDFGDRESSTPENRDVDEKSGEPIQQNMDYAEDVLELHPTMEFELDMENTSDSVHMKQNTDDKDTAKDHHQTSRLFEEGEIVSEGSNMAWDKSTHSKQSERNASKKSKRSRRPSSRKENDRLSVGHEQVRRSPRKARRTQQTEPRRDSESTSPRSCRHSPKKNSGRASNRSRSSRSRDTRTALHERSYSSNKESSTRSRRR